MTAARDFQPRTALDGFAVAVMITLTFAWGLNGVAAKIANTGFNPVAVTFMRSVIGMALVLLWCRWRGIRLLDRDGTWWPGLLAGFLFAVEFVLIYVGLEFTSVARSALMTNTMPFWVLLGAHFLLGEHITLLKLGGLILAFLGVVLVFSDSLSAIGPQTIIGDIMSLGAGLMWALTTLVIKGSALNRTIAEKLLLYQIGVTSAVMLLLLPFAGPFMRDVSAAAITSVVLQGSLIVAVSYLCWFWIMRQYPASGLSSFAFLTPAFGVICGAVVLDEPLTMRIFAALVLIAVGLMIVNRPSRRTIPA